MKSQSPQRVQPARNPRAGRQSVADGRSSGGWERLKARLAEPVNGASLALFRISLGIVMALEAWSLMRPDPAAISSGRSPLETYYTGPEITFHFPYELFSWLPLFPPRWIETFVLIQAVAGIMMALGLFYRVSAAAVFLTWGYLWVVESTRTYWQSHYYLETLLTFLMIWMPAARRYSVDALLARKRNAAVAQTGQEPGPPKGGTPNVRSPAFRQSLVPYWTLFLLRGQLLIAYFFAGVAKLNPDWLLDAMPVRWFIAQPHVTAPYERFLAPAQIEAFKGFLHNAKVAYFLSYTGLAFDLAIGFLLLARRTRIFGLVLMLLFHATNHLLIFDDIGWFPLVGILTALIFLDPDWPERFWRWLRRPRIAKPDWNWFVGGAVAVPIAGAALGWKLRPSETGGTGVVPHRLGRGVVPFAVVWLLWQTLMPIRHYFIEGDGRFTYEGLSLSWRLKSEVRRAYAVQLFVIDPHIISGGQIDWTQWRNEKVIYRTVTPGRINWQTLPEIVVLVEPIVGERVVYNPYAAGARTEAEARERLSRIWSEMYGHAPKAVRRASTLSHILGLMAAVGPREEADRIAGVLSQAKQLDQFQLPPQQAMQAHAAVTRVINELRHSAVPYLRAMEPFALDGERSGAPFLIIDDPEVTGELTKSSPRVSREHWKNSRYTRSPNVPNRNIGAEPLVIHLASIGPESRELLPRECIFDSLDQPAQAPYIWWNCVGDLPVSKVMHISYQAFYLRRYARRVAGLWEEEYGRRPAVQANTAVSLNGRPHQMLVDPAVDLGSVPVRRFTHNFWIRQLETQRIPREALENPPVL